MTEEVTGTESVESAPVSTESTASAPDTTASSVETQPTLGTETPVAPAYTPNFKFKVLDKEHEFDPMFRSLVKDAETEKKLREFHEKAFGIDNIKKNYEAEKLTHAETKKIAEKYSTLDKELKTLGGFLGKGDYTNFFKNINVSEKEVFEWVQKRINEMSLPQEQQQALRAQELERERLYYLEQQNQEIQTAMEKQQVQARTYELDFVLAKPETQSFASKYDAVVGQPGAFKQAVIETGAFIYDRHKIDLPVEQVVQQTMQKYGKFLSGQPQATETTSSQAKEPPPVIPHVAGKGVSPVKQRPKNLDELKKLAQSFQ